jgi:N-acetylglucosaminyl-diphospho-decaprenol L-rhamnosyltransferase
MNSMDKPPLTIILSPHFDDAVISLGGYLAQRSGETIVVTVFGGRPTPSRRAIGWAADAGFRTSDEEVTARTGENGRALDRFSAKAHNLAFLDKPYRDLAFDRSLPASIALEIDAIVKTQGPRDVHLYGPAALPRVGFPLVHTDHRIVHDAFIVVAKQNPANVRNFFYEDIPYAAWGPATSNGFKDLLQRTDRLSVKERVSPLSPQQLMEKSSGIKEYASQVRAAKQRREDFQAFALRFARGRGNNPWHACDACEIVYEICDFTDDNASALAFDSKVRGAMPVVGERTSILSAKDGSLKTDSSSATPGGRSLEPRGQVSGESLMPQPHPPLVTAVMVTYRSFNSVGASLGALKQGFEKGALHCIVVDNDSPDGTADLVAREHSWAKLIRSPLNLGYGRGCNLGFEHVQTPYVLVMNPDVIIERDAVECLVKFMEENPRAAMTAPSTIFGGDAYQHVGGLPTPWSIVAEASGIPGLRTNPVTLLPDSAPFCTDWLCGAVMLIRSKVLRDLGGFDPRFFLYFEETDLCLRIQNAGHQLWAVGAAKAAHAGGSSVRRIDPTLVPGENLAIHYFPSRYYYLTKHYGRIAAMGAEGADLILKAVRDLLRAVLGKPSKNEFRTRTRAPVFAVPPRVV